jgi:hypothetical protein
LEKWNKEDPNIVKEEKQGWNGNVQNVSKFSKPQEKLEFLNLIGC